MESEAMEVEGWVGNSDLDRQERDHIFNVLDSFRQYRRAAHHSTTHTRRQNFYALPQAHQDYLSGPPFNMLDTFSRIDDAIDRNADLAKRIMLVGAASFCIDASNNGDDPPWAGYADKHNIDKCCSTLNQLFRDWSTEGAAERQACFDPILQDLQKHVASPRAKAKVLIPGAGLSRLVYELSKAGYQVEGNEISYHQLLTSSFMLNHTEGAASIALYPFVATFSNNHTRNDQLRRVMIPDEWPGDLCQTSPSSIPESEDNMLTSISMTAGDFCVTYSEAGYAATFDAVATVFFIDTAPNVIRYIETIRHCLKPGGIWTNIGPLLWHFRTSHAGKGDESGGEYHGAAGATGSGIAADAVDRGVGEPGSVELSQEEVMAIIRDHGFDVVEEEAGNLSMGYMQDPSNMLQHVYRPVHWVARKRS